MRRYPEKGVVYRVEDVLGRPVINESFPDGTIGWRVLEYYFIITVFDDFLI